MIFIFSSPRSGSTWLAKTLGSHPETIYLHEPDIVDRGWDLLPNWFADEPLDYEEKAAQYLARLASNRAIRTMGTPPFFRKRFRSEPSRLLRVGLIYLGKAVEKAGFTSLAGKMRVPDFAKKDVARTIVIKSVSALGRAEAFLRSGYPMTPILLLRHPCGYVHSYIKGMQLGVMSGKGRLGDLLNTRSARRLNAQEAVSESMDLVDLLAWEWLVSNAEAHAAITKAGGIVVNYDELARDPEPRMRELFSTLGLSWADSTTQFLKQAASGDGSYYSLSRSAGSADRWSAQMKPEEIERVRRIVCQDEIGRRFFP